MASSRKTEKTGQAAAAWQELETIGCIGMRLRQAMRQATQLLDAGLKPAGIAITQFAPLAYLYRDGALGMGELAERIGADPTTLTRLLRPLERRGLLRAEIAAEDRRRRLIQLTPAGRAVFEQALPLWQAAHATIVARIGNAEADALRQQLDHIQNRLAR